jgi:lysophospholipase L1-like esterase
MFAAGAAGVILAGTASVGSAAPRPADHPSSAPGLTATRAGGSPVNAWATSPTQIGVHYANRTVRNIVHTAAAGRNVRVRLSNVFGTVPITFDSVFLGRQADGAQLQDGSNRRLTFAGKTSVTVATGTEVLSDPLPIEVPAATNLAVSAFVSGETGEITGHLSAQQTSFLAEGDAAADPTAAQFETSIQSWHFVDGLVVDAPTAAGTVVALGDSITDGTGSTVDANHRWPDFLAARLNGRTTRFGVANEGIAGNQLNADVAVFPAVGERALARFDRDVLSQPGVRTVVLFEGINDIGLSSASADQLIAADKQLIARAHARGVRIVGATLTPFAGTEFQAGPDNPYFTPAKDETRKQLNRWIRTGGAFDAVVDFERVARDPADPDKIRAEFDSGDHLHLSDAGYQALAASIPLSVL